MVQNNGMSQDVADRLEKLKALREQQAELSRGLDVLYGENGTERARALELISQADEIADELGRIKLAFDFAGFAFPRRHRENENGEPVKADGTPKAKPGRKGKKETTAQ